MKPLACQLNENPVKGVVWGTWPGLWAFHFKCVDETPDGPALVAAQIIYHPASVGRFAHGCLAEVDFFFKKKNIGLSMFSISLFARDECGRLSPEMQSSGVIAM